MRDFYLALEAEHRAQATLHTSQADRYATLAEQQTPEGAPRDDRASGERIEALRLDVKGCAALLNRSPSFVYRHVVPSSPLPIIPHRRLAGHLSFVAQEVEQWLQQNEVVRQSAAEESAAQTELERRIRERHRQARLTHRRLGQ
jgi:hypothetical protein